MRSGRRATEARRAAFVAALEKGLSVSAAARSVGVDRATACQWRKRYPALAAAWDAAVERGTDKLEDEAWRRAVEGTERRLLVGGKQVGGVRQYNGRLLAFLLQARRPDLHRIASTTDDPAAGTAERLAAARKRGGM